MILSASCLFDDHDCEMLECNLLVIVRTELFVVACETIVICLSLSWCGSFNKSFVDDHDGGMLESNLLVIVRTELFVGVSETIAICLLLPWHDSFSKLPV